MTDTPQGPTLRRRAMLAIALTVAFYTLALVIALGLLAGAILPWVHGRGAAWLSVALGGAAIAILRAIVPERDRFEPPGPELTAADQPELHAFVAEIASRAGEAPPDVVYVDLDVNAWVAERGGRRVMTLGLPLMAVLSRDELRAVIAHELGHYAGGDTRFSAWIWRTRVAVLKTAAHLAGSESWFRRSVVRWPFEGYARLFLRLTEAISRRQEFVADAVSARVAGAQAAGTALRRLAGVAPAYDGFWQSDVAPMLSARRRPPMASGFRTLTEHVDLAGALDEVVEANLEEAEADAYASHPTLRQRLEALGVAPEANVPPPTGDPALGLLRDVAALERRLLAVRFGEEVGAFAPVDWEEAGAVHLVRHRGLVERFASVLAPGLTVGQAGDAAGRAPASSPALRALLDPEDRDVEAEELDGLFVSVLAAAVAVALVDAGGTLTAVPGEPLLVRHRAHTVKPWELFDIVQGHRTAETWRAATAEAGVEALAIRR